MLRWIDLDFENRIVKVTPEKGWRPKSPEDKHQTYRDAQRFA